MGAPGPLGPQGPALAGHAKLNTKLYWAIWGLDGNPWTPMGHRLFRGGTMAPGALMGCALMAPWTPARPRLFRGELKGPPRPSWAGP